MTEDIQIHDQCFTLHPTGSLFWQEKKALLISDVHLGKVSHFRKYGAAVPQKAIHANFRLMDEAMDFFNPSTIYFLGDLFHSYINNEWPLFEKWTSEHNCEIILINGNHDIIPPQKYEALGIAVFDEFILENFLLTHHPEVRKNLFNFCGHIHPAVKIRGLGKQSIRLPCFFKSHTQMILPAFGEFTGSHTLKPSKKDQVFAIADGMIIKI